MEYIGYNAFFAEYSQNTLHVYYEGNEIQWNKVEKIPDQVGKIQSAKVFFNATGMEAPQIVDIQVSEKGETAEIQLSNTEYDSDLIAVFCNKSSMINSERIDIYAGDAKKTVGIPSGGRIRKSVYLGQPQHNVSALRAENNKYKLKILWK